ncbi:chymotrypsinogen 2-like isoform X2 [Periplaneta americana]
MRLPTMFVAIAVTCWLHLVAAAPGPDLPETNEADHGHSTSGCDCMEYWTCVMSGGNPYSYCGLSESNVCCFVPQGAKPVGLFPPATGHRPNKGRCGKKGIDSGRDGIAEPSEWPWHAAVLEKPDDLYVCGASLLDESWVLTAAHCVDDYVSTRGEALKVRLGEHDVTSTTETLRHEEYDVAGVVLYPGFDNTTLAHDIALIRLRHPAKQRPNIDVVCLPKQGSKFPDTTDSQSHTRCVITGWGRRSETSEHSVVLKEVTVPLWQNKDCERALRQQFGSSYSLPETSICAGAEGRDACDGDGGGPLVCEQEGQWYQIGVVSFGIGCGRRNTPGVYTRVSLYEQWITDTVLRHKNRQ